MRLHDGLLAISESSRREAIDHLGFDPGCVFNMRAGFDAAVFRPTVLQGEERAAFLARHGLRDGYVLFVGAGDARKNERGLIEAYALLPPALRQRHQLVIVGTGGTEALQGAAASFGLQPGKLLLPSHIPEHEMAALYSTCHLFVLPSMHEGFGLPALEAMACGAPVIASNATSMPEVVGCEAALFDPYDPGSIAERMGAALRDEAFRLRLAEHGLRRSAEFTWEDSARRAWAGLETLLERNGSSPRPQRGTVPGRKPRLAFVGALPQPLPSFGDGELLCELARHYDITLVTRAALSADDAVGLAFPSLSESAFTAQARSFDRILYRVGGTEADRFIRQSLLPVFPGVVLLHDACLGEMHLAEFRQSGDRDALARSLFDSHGWPAIAALHRDGPPEALRDMACTAPVFRDALAVVQRTAHARSVACRAVGPSAVEMVRLLPPVRRPSPRLAKSAARSALGVAGEGSVTVAIGSLAAAEEARRVMQAWHLAMQDEPEARLVLIGAIEAGVAAGLHALATQDGVAAGRLLVVDSPDHATYRRWLQAADMAVQTPTAWRGEALDVILDALSMGLPVLTVGGVSELELPNDAICALPSDAAPAVLAAALGGLWRDAAQREALAAAGLGFVRDHLAPRAAAGRYRAVIEDAYSRGTPAHLLASLPALPVDDQADAVLALVQNFETAAPRRLLLDASCADDARAGMGELVRRALLAPGDGWIAELVRCDGEVLRFARGPAARMIGVPLHGLPETAVSGRATDMLLVPVDAAANPGLLRGLRRRGVQVIALLAKAFGEEPPEILAIADRVLCTSAALAETVQASLAQHPTERRRDVGVSSGDPEEALRALKS